MPTCSYLRTKENNEKMRQSLLGRKFTNEWKKNISKGKKGKASIRPGYKHSEETKEKIGKSNLGKKKSDEAKRKMSEKKKGKYIGSNHPLWIEDRSKVVPQKERKTFEYLTFRRKVLERDKKKCRISDCNCSDRLEVHHILTWALFPELRYNVDNGITLCSYHHPHKKIEVERLVPYFQEIISKSKIYA